MARKAERKTFPLMMTKVNEDDGTFRGYASIFDVVDSYGDIVKKGAFKRTLKNNGAFHLCWTHDPADPIGIVTGEEDEKGLLVDGKFDPGIQRANEVRAHAKQALDAGVPMGLSIGYQTLKEDLDREAGTRLLKEINLWEVSLCLFQACPGAVISEVKTDDDQDPAEATPDDKGDPAASHSLTDYAAFVRKSISHKEAN